MGLLARHNIDVLLDVGANQGQYAREFRATGFRGRMVSFEPMSEAFNLLSKAAARDALWDVRQSALGSRCGERQLQVSANSVSSSILPILERHIAAEPMSQYVRSEAVSMSTLDDEVGSDNELSRYWLKLDVQGYESAVLEGATCTLRRTRVVQCELSTVPLYDGQATYLDILRRLEDADFVPVYLIPGFTDPGTGEMLQFDVIAANRGLGP